MECPVEYIPKEKIWIHRAKTINTKLSIGQIILQKLNQYDPNKLIEVNYDNDRKLTASDMKQLTITCAQNLLDLGIGVGDVIVFYSTLNSLTTPLVYACYIIGAVLNSMELNLNDDDTEYLLEQLNPTIIVYDDEFEANVRDIAERKILSKLKLILPFGLRKDGGTVQDILFKTRDISGFVAPELGDPDKLLAALVLTSGSTGRPKPICLSHSQIAFGVTRWWTTNSNSVVYIASPFRWISQISAILMPIFIQAARAFTGQPPTAELCLDLICKYHVTNIFAVTGLITKILQHAEQLGGNTLKNAQYLLSGGERISKLVDDSIHKIIPQAIFIKAYGMTELGGCICTDEFLANKTTGGGYIVAGSSLKIIDNQKCSLGPNQNGQVCFKINIPYLKYWKNDEINREAFTEDDWLITGDYGHIDENKILHVYNRYKDLIRCDGKIIIPNIVEKNLDSHPAINVSYIVGIPDQLRGEIPVAFIKMESSSKSHDDDDDNVKDDIKKFLLSVLPADQMLPEIIYFLDIIPLTSCGKVDKVRLRNIAIEHII